MLIYHRVKSIRLKKTLETDLVYTVRCYLTAHRLGGFSVIDFGSMLTLDRVVLLKVKDKKTGWFTWQAIYYQYVLLLRI